MSIKLMSQVWESDLPSGEKFTLLALADHARDDGSRVYPSIATVARKTGFSARTVQRQLRRLEAAGILSVVKKSMRYGTTEYFIRGDRLSPLKSSRGDKYDAQGCQSDTPGVTNTTSRGDTVSPESSVNHQLKHTHNQAVCVSEAEKRFEEFWTVYPFRDGQKKGREKTKALFLTLPAEDQVLLIAAARAYAGSAAVQRGVGIMDPQNFIRRRDRETGESVEPWREWATAALTHSLDTREVRERQRREKEWERQQREEKEAEIERAIERGEMKRVPRPRLPFLESEAAYAAKVAAGKVPMIVVPVEVVAV